MTEEIRVEILHAKMQWYEDNIKMLERMIEEFRSDQFSIGLELQEIENVSKTWPGASGPVA